MVRNLQHIRLHRLLASIHPHQSLLLNIGSKQDCMWTTSERRDDGPIVQRMTFLSSTSLCLMNCIRHRRIENREPTMAEREAILKLPGDMFGHSPLYQRLL